MKPVIIVPAYKRAIALKRLLDSLEVAVYPLSDIELIISLEGGYTDEVRSVAESFKNVFSHGIVKVYERKTRIGIRKHILWCGDQSIQFGSVIVLEDDVIVDKYFYYFALAASSEYENEDNIAGIALYSPRFNEFAKLPFEPMRNGYSGYFMQLACSWGQLWTDNQWMKFRIWYKSATKALIDSCLCLPEEIKKWPETSWKKYFTAYLVEKNLFIFYPYNAYTTNCSDNGGTHIKEASNLFQVPLSCFNRHVDEFNLPKFTRKEAMYDSFMEAISNEFLESIGYNLDNIEIDLYGTKPMNLLTKKKYVLTSRKCSFPLETFMLQFKPIEKLYLAKCEYSNHFNAVYVVRPENIRKMHQPRFKLAQYYSYFPLFSKKFIFQYCYELLNQIINTIFKWNM